MGGESAARGSAAGWAGRLAGAVLATAACGALQAQVMSLPGQFAVNESGAATYSIPIEVPPGVAGLAPKLSLDYSSQAGNGLLGVGWSLGGLSTITRCPRTLAQDGASGSINYDLNDRYCLDGQRLMVVGGNYGAANSEYRTELESYSKVVAYGTAGNGPSYFKVQTKAGLTLEFGATADSRVAAQGKATIAHWALNKITDAKGNALAIKYLQEHSVGIARPESISYSGQVISLVYDQVEEAPPVYASGSYAKLADRLSRIDIGDGRLISKSYRLSYVSELNLSRLIKLELCAESLCLASTTFQWSAGEGAFNGAGGGYWNGFIGRGVENFPGDFNADGKTDLMAYRGNGVWQVCLSTGRDFNCQDWSGHSGGGLNNIVADFDGDGFTDIAGHTGNKSHLWHVCYSKGSFFECDYKSINAAGVSGSIVGDFNGDGRADVAAWTGSGHNWHVCYSVGRDFQCAYPDLISMSGDRTVVADFDGDGRSDVGAYSENAAVWHFCRGQGQGFDCFYQDVDLKVSRADIVVGDFNGDGLSDMASYTGSDDRWHVCTSTGVGFDCVAASVFSSSAKYVISGDFNGDGRTDLVTDGGSHVWRILFGNGAQFIDGGTWSGHDGGYDINYGGDFNGDGVSDMAAFTGRDGEWHVTLSGKNPARLDSIDDGFKQILLAQKPLTDSVVYEKRAGSVYPIIDIQTPMYVVSQSRMSNGLGGWNATNYSYGALIAEQGTGRGSLGFRWTRVKEEATGLEHYTEYSQDWPFVGSATLAETRLTGKGNGGLLKRIVTSYQQQNGSHGSTRFVYAGSTVETSWDLNGTAYPTVTTTSAYNNWGDATQIKVSTSDGGSVTTDNEYLDANTSGGKWILGRLKKASVTQVTP
ncbi:MAG: SpvB/TcaC N-terminal domain-containing protein [Comamonas sp.]